MTAQDAAALGASTKRAPAASGGKVAAPVTYLTDLFIMPPLPPLQSNRELLQQVTLANPREGKLTYAFPDSSGALPDVAEGDLLVVGDTEYLVHLVNEWLRPDDGSYLEILMVERKVAI